MSNYRENNENMIAYEYVEDPDKYINQLIEATPDPDEKNNLEEIKGWPDYAKTKWVLSKDGSDIKILGVGGCLVVTMIAVTVAYYVWVWITEEDDQGNNTKKKIRERRERIEEVQKMVHSQSHKGGKCPD